MVEERFYLGSIMKLQGYSFIFSFTHNIHILSPGFPPLTWHHFKASIMKLPVLHISCSLCTVTRMLGPWTVRLSKVESVAKDVTCTIPSGPYFTGWTSVGISLLGKLEREGEDGAELSPEESSRIEMNNFLNNLLSFQK